MTEMQLEDLCGEHLLTGVDRCSERIEDWPNSGRYEDCDVLNFTLDGKTYTACEDPDDGYRSHMRYLRVSDKPTINNFPPVKVIGRMKEDDTYSRNHVLQLIDAANGKTILEVGTENTDDYYPYWVAHFSPEDMACNQNR